MINNMLNRNFKCIVALLCGMLVAFVGSIIILQSKAKTASHPVGTSHGDMVHVHGDFRMYIGDERIRFTEAKYQSSPEQTHHASLHFHDGNDEVIHRHADGVSLMEFFDSIGMELKNDCLTMDTGTKYCTNATGTLMLIVNNERTMDIENYIFAEEDRILIYYGDPTNPKIRDYTVSVTDIACMYSGTCPERGTPPTEGCGMTCEVADAGIEEKNLWQKTIVFFQSFLHFDSHEATH
jgi:hypothetical protein